MIQYVKLNFNGGQPSKLFWFEASKVFLSLSDLTLAIFLPPLNQDIKSQIF